MSGNYPDPVGKGSMERVPPKDKRSERSPDYRGRITVKGEEFWISGWDRDGRNGPFISLSIEPKMARDWAGGSKNPPTPTADQVKPGGSKPAEPEFDDDIPF